jgi:hypothetical protein
MKWYQLGLACALGLMGGIVLGGTWEDGDTLLLLVGALMLILGVLAVLHAVCRWRRIHIRPSTVADSDLEAAPLLGQMLVNYRLISEAALAAALEHQEKSGERLGRVLVRMGLVTSAQLADVLEEQLSRRHCKARAPRRAATSTDPEHSASAPPVEWVAWPNGEFPRGGRWVSATSGIAEYRWYERAGNADEVRTPTSHN